MKPLIIFFIVALAIKYQTEATDPCKTYIEEDNYQRSTAFTLPKDTKTKKCDRPFRRGWYRFTSGAGGLIPADCPKEYSCGTRGPIWVKGTYPKQDGETRTLLACARILTKCCALSWNVEVKKCFEKSESFFVYNLKEAPGCPMAYCAGSEKKCSDLESSPTGFTPGCTSIYPKLTKDPEVSVINKATGRLQFKCKIDTSEKQETVRHEITWFQGTPGTEIKKDIISWPATEVQLENNNTRDDPPLFHLGQQIFCKVRSYHNYTPQTLSPYYTSNFFFAGLKISQKEIYLSESDPPKKLHLTSTVPIICESNSSDCILSAEIAQTSSQIVLTTCKVSFHGSWLAGKTETFEVAAKRDFTDDGDQDLLLRITVPPFHYGYTDWNYYADTLLVEVKTKDVRTAICTNRADPHIHTFDGLHYDHFSVGDYVLVESKTRNFTVHIRTWQCNAVSCDCGVAVQEDNDVVTIDMCKNKVPTVRFRSNVLPRAQVERDQNGKRFKVNLPSGAYVLFTSKSSEGLNYADIKVQVPSDDYNNTSGLCGTFDDDRSNDMISKNGTLYSDIVTEGVQGPKDFIDSWKIHTGKSLFYYRDENQNCSLPDTPYSCLCEEKNNRINVTCYKDRYYQRPTYSNGRNGWTSLVFEGAKPCRRRKRRALNDDAITLPAIGDEDTYIYDPPAFNISMPSFPTLKGKTERNARNACISSIGNSAVGKACLKTIQNFDIQLYIDQCITDVRVLDDYTLAIQSAIEDMADICEEITLRKKSKYWKKDASGNLAPPQEIGNSLCPSECNGNGFCSNGTCICKEDFITADCSLKKGQIPILHSVANDALCDIRRQDCELAQVIGDGFIDNSRLNCKMTEAKVSETSSPMKTGTINITNGQLLSFREINCFLPRTPVAVNGNPSEHNGKATAAFYIKAANDGIKFSSEEVVIIIYDSKCIECTKNGTRTCRLKANSCKINGYCFAENDANPNNWCQVCDPQRDTLNFVKRLVNKSPKFSNVPTLYAFKGQKWRYQLSATDPEFRSVKYYFVGESYGMHLSSAGVITWIPAELKVYNFTIKAEDPCGLSASKQFSIDVKACSCEGNNDGKCAWKNPAQPHNGSFCVCPTGCKGETCMEAIEGMTCNIKEKMYVFKGQKWNYTIATDQTPCPPMQYTLTGKRYGMNLSSEGLIMWIPLDVKVYKFTVNLKDSCGLNAYKQFTVKVINCFCEDQSNGTCMWKNPLNPKDGSFCACPDECKGERCTEPVEGMACHKKIERISTENSISLVIILPVVLCIILVVVVVSLGLVWKRKNNIKKNKAVELLTFQNINTGKSDQ